MHRIVTNVNYSIGRLSDNPHFISQPAASYATTKKKMSVIKILSVLFLILLLASCYGRFDHGPSYGETGSSTFISNGERIYFTGNSASGIPINANGGSSHMNARMRMHGTGCASCHGAEREGRRLWPKFWSKAPPLTADALFENGEHDSGSDGHGDHGSYDSESLARAITQGIDPAGDQLDDAMPRWNMSPSDLNDLIDYLQQTHSHD